ncbi:hypothetical protein [uncultured Alteromonas sp.]|jgi:hypothetical protein|uniref:hypothetical protein n=1 Tax=uncultured Alteromonas sp. TaxID=179113 RepID=UPI0025E7F21E|nr:hypothetical protein [uncultured Alteromonas sp.]
MQKHRLTRLWACVSLVVASGCAQTSDNELYPATLSAQTKQQKVQIEKVISDWFGGTKVTLADDVFTSSSVVTIERREHLDSQGRLIEGRHDKQAYSFTLYKKGTQCLLSNDGTGKKVELDNLECIATEN